MGINFAILGLVFMSNGKVTDDVLFKFHDAIGFNNDSELSSFFDEDIKKYVNDVLVTKQHYLRYKIRVYCSYFVFTTGVLPKEIIILYYQNFVINTKSLFTV